MTVYSHINDAVAQIPDGYRAKVLYTLGQLRSDSPQIRDDAIRNAHHLAAHLKEIADGHGSSPLVMDSCRPVCARVVDYIYGAMDVARDKNRNVWNQRA